MDMISEYNGPDMQISAMINSELTPEEYVLWRAHVGYIVYALTNTRLLVIPSNKAATSYSSIVKGSLKYESKKDGIGKITFQAAPSMPKVTLENIPQVETVAFILTSILNKS